MRLDSIDITSAMRRLADRRIEQAMREGKFDNLPGAGQPLNLEPIPADENARLLFWALRILKRNDVIPDEIRLRKMIDHLKARLALLCDESALIPLVAQINHLVHKLNTLGTNALACNIAPLDLETERLRLRHRLAQRAAAVTQHSAPSTQH